jgi:hypothetical protein
MVPTQEPVRSASLAPSPWQSSSAPSVLAQTATNIPTSAASAAHAPNVQRPHSRHVTPTRSRFPIDAAVARSLTRVFASMPHSSTAGSMAARGAAPCRAAQGQNRPVLRHSDSARTRHLKSPAFTVVRVSSARPTAAIVPSSAPMAGRAPAILRRAMPVRLAGWRSGRKLTCAAAAHRLATASASRRPSLSMHPRRAAAVLRAQMGARFTTRREDTRTTSRAIRR